MMELLRLSLSLPTQTQTKTSTFAMTETTEPTTMEAPTLTPAQLQAQLEQLKASATQQYSLKNYSAAAEFYSEAAEVQDQVNGEMSPDNSDLLYQYGRCLYHLGVSKSDVLGGKVAGNNNNGGSEEPKRKKRKTAAAPAVAESSAAGGERAVADALKNGEQKLAEVEEEREEDGKAEEAAAAASSSKPFFQITGDENWTDSEEEDDDDGEDAGEGGDEEEEEDDDFAIAYEILDVARVLLGRKLESLDASSPEARQVKERLADTHDLQAEIKLENEQFADAVTDAKAALSFKLQLYPQESGMIAEAHYKLAIALDFASLPVTSAEDEEQNATASSSAPKEEPKVNEEMRAEAAAEMEKAIASCQLRIKPTEASGKPQAASTIADIKSMVSEMKNRLVDLRNPSQALIPAGGPADVPDGADPLRGVLGAMLGTSKAEQAKRIQEATSQANDLSGLVKKRKAKVVEDGAASEGKGKKAKIEEEK
jgi:HAT1-interacting factor 1